MMSQAGYDEFDRYARQAKETQLQNTLVMQIEELSPGARCCYFPMEEKYVVHDAKYDDISKYHFSKTDALQEALDILKNKP